MCEQAGVISPEVDEKEKEEDDDDDDDDVEK